MDYKVRWYNRPGWSKTELIVDKPRPVSFQEVLADLDLQDGDTVRIEKVPAGEVHKPGLGWACPKCKRVYAPTVLECPRCNGRK